MTGMESSSQSPPCACQALQSIRLEDAAGPPTAHQRHGQGNVNGQPRHLLAGPGQPSERPQEPPDVEEGEERLKIRDWRAWSAEGRAGLTPSVLAVLPFEACAASVSLRQSERQPRNRLCDEGHDAAQGQEKGQKLIHGGVVSRRAEWLPTACHFPAAPASSRGSQWRLWRCPGHW